MAPSSAEAPIDLTLDSDDEAGSSQIRAVPPDYSPTVPVSWPNSAPLQPSSSTHHMQSTAAPLPGSQLLNGRPTASLPRPEDLPPYASASDMLGNSDTPGSSRPLNSIGHIPVFAAAAHRREANEFAVDQAEKRRKISGPPPGLEFNLADSIAGPVRQRIGSKPRFYGVKVGHKPGVYTDWTTTQQQIVGCKGAKQQRFDTREEAQAFVDGMPSPNPRFAHHRKNSSYANSGEGPQSRPSLSSSALLHSCPSDVQQAPLAAPAAVAPPSIGAQSSLPTAKLSTNGLPSVQSLNSVLKANGTGMPVEAHIDITHPSRELHFGRVPYSASTNGKTQPNSHKGADAPVSVDEIMVDRPDSSHQATKFDQLTPESVSIVDPVDTNDVLSEGNVHANQDPFETLLEDEIILELLQQAPANDKVALLLRAHPRGQSLVEKVKEFPIRRSPSQRLPERTPLHTVKSHPAPLSERDSVFSDSDTPDRGDAARKSNLVSTSSKVRRIMASVEQSSGNKKWTGGLSEAEAHLLIFLKEVKRLRWPDITTKFQEHYPDRKYATLQTNYSQKINRRDRSEDPTTLILPSMYASEAQVDWAEVHGNLDRPRGHPKQRREVHALQREHHHRGSSATVGSTQEQSSGTESTSHHTRPRRAVPVKNYTWPKKNTQIEGGPFDDNDFDMLMPAGEIIPEIKTPENNVPTLEKAIPVNNEPIAVDFAGDDAFSALCAHNGEATSGAHQLPYLSSLQRSHTRNVPRDFEWDQLVSRDWQGTQIHVDFSANELNLVRGSIERLLGPQRILRSQNLRSYFQRALHKLTEPLLLRLNGALRSILLSRDRQSIDAFLQDAKEGKIRCENPRVQRLAASRPGQTFSSDARASTSSMIRRRELGLQSHRGWNSATKPLSYRLKNTVMDSFGPVSSYTGASSDVHTVAWSIDGQCFAAGAICVDDEHSMQYNRPNNLMYGDVSRNIIHELGKHHVQRPKLESGPNSTHAMYVSQDPKLYKTVTSVAFSPSGRYMYSSGWDRDVWVWQTKYDGSQPSDRVSLHHRAEVIRMTINTSGVLATATKKSTGRSVKVLNVDEDDPTQTTTLNFSSEKAAARPDNRILPTALHFSPRHENLLLGGFGSHVRSDGRDTSGDICLWDINGNNQINIWGSGSFVHDLAFHPRERWMAAATVAGQHTNRGMRSTVRVYSEQGHPTDNKFSKLMELECPALDINDVVWCPGNGFLVAVGCTSGRAYVWDIRNPNHFLRELGHGNSLTPLDEYTDREDADTGIQFLSWGDNATRLYSGSSDGVVKVWNVARSEEETFVKDLITLDSGVMSGAFSPDRSRLVLGEVNGSVNVLEVGRDDCSLRDVEKMKHIPYEEDEDHYNEMQPSVSNLGICSASELIASGQMMIKPMGGLPVNQAVQGPFYSGPYDQGVDAPFLREQALEMQLKFSSESKSSCSVCGESNAHRITSEEIGDSGRSMDRIPDELRLHWEAGPGRPLPGKALCSHCGRAARPADGIALPECERCAFACLRCGCKLAEPLQSKTEVFECSSCNGAWEIGAVGYDLIRPVHRDTKEKHLAKSDVYFTHSDLDTTYGDEMNALTDYYFSLAIDRPESPPL